jgi:hypothetical protein
MSETEGRGRLSSMDLVPEHAQGEILWAVRELNKRDQTQDAIREALNTRLEAIGVEPISRSAFNRKAIRLSALRKRITMSREVFAGLADEFTAERVDENTVALGEVIKMLIADLVSDGEDRSPKELKDIADAFRSIVSGQKLSAERRRKIETEAEAKAAAKTVAAVERVAREGGLSPEVVAQLRREFLGVRPKSPEAQPNG